MSRLSEAVNLFLLGQQRVNLAAALLERGESSVRLSPTEVRLLRYLAASGGRIVSREELLTEVWGYPQGEDSRTIDTTTARLRAKIEPDPSAPRYLLAVYGRGLRLDGAVVLSAREPLVGRDEVIGTALEMLRAGLPLVTVTGPAGVGKTSLVNEVARQTLREVISLSCESLSCQSQGLSEARERLSRLEGIRSGLVVIGACDVSPREALALVDEAIARGAQVLAESRSALGHPREQQLPLAPLSLEASIALLSEKLGRLAPGNNIPPEEIARIASELEGIPLAIGLAAAQIAPCAGGSAPGVARRSPISETLARSLDPLSEEERAVLKAAALFQAPFDLTDLAGVAAAPLPRVASQLASLVARSLVWLEEGAARPYRLLRAVRERVCEGIPEGDPARMAYATWLSRLGEPELIDRERVHPDFIERLAELEPDLLEAASIAEAIAPEVSARCTLAAVWSAGKRSPEASLARARRASVLAAGRARAKLAIEQGWLWLRVGGYREGLAAVEASLAGEVHPTDAVELLVIASRCLLFLGELGPSSLAREQARGLLASAGVAETVWWSYPPESLSPDERADWMRQALSSLRRWGDRAGEALTLIRLAHQVHARAGAFDVARRAYERAGKLCEAPWGDEIAAERALYQGRLELDVGDLDRAEQLFAEASARGRLRSRDDRQMIDLLLARVALYRGDLEGAWLEAEVIARRATREDLVAHGALVSAMVALRRGEVDWARAKLSSALSGAGLWPRLRAEILEHLAAIDSDARYLSEADQIDSSLVGRAAREAIAALLLACAGRAQEASMRRGVALALADDLGLLPGSLARWWLARAGEAPDKRS